MRLKPHGAGTGTFDACAYQLFTHGDAADAHEGIAYDKIILTAPDINSNLLSQLDFVAQSVVGGPLMEHSLLFHGVDGEEYGIDAAVVFTAQEPGAEPIVFAYRTLARIRDCRMPGRPYHDVVRSTMQGRSFINQVNLITAQVIRSHCRCNHAGSEPDRDIGYHQNYKSHGSWRLQRALVNHDPMESRRNPSLSNGTRLICPLRYPTVWIELPDPVDPVEPAGPKGCQCAGAAAHKRRRRGARV